MRVKERYSAHGMDDSPPRAQSSARYPHRQRIATVSVHVLPGHGVCRGVAALRAGRCGVESVVALGVGARLRTGSITRELDVARVAR